MGFPSLPRAFSLKDSTYAPPRIAPPLIYALSLAEEEVAEVIMTKGTPLNTLDEEGFSVAHYIAKVIDETEAEGQASQIFEAQHKKLKKQTNETDARLALNKKHVEEGTHAKDAYGRDIPHLTEKTIEKLINSQEKLGKALAEMDVQLAERENERLTKISSACSFLATHGMDFNTLGREGITPLMRFAQNPKASPVIGQLVKFHEANLNAVDERGFNAADYAFQALNGDVLQFIMKFLSKESEGLAPVSQMLINAVYSSPEASHEDPNSFARRHMFLLILKTLPKDPIILNAKDEDGNTPLMIATATGQEDVVETLLQMGADVNVQNKNGETAIMLAVAEKQTDIIRMILQKDPDMSLQSSKGLTVMELGPAYSNHAVKVALNSKDDLVMKPIDDVDAEISERIEKAHSLWDKLIEPASASLLSRKRVGF